MPKAQDYINQNYSYQDRSTIKNLNLRDKTLEGNLDLTQLNASKLTYLRIANNNLSERDLSMFSNFVNLEVLIVGNDSDKKNNNLGVSIINEALRTYNFQISKWRQNHDPNYISFQVQLNKKGERIRELENQVKEYQETLVQFSEQLGQKEARQAETQITEEQIAQGGNSASSLLLLKDIIK